MADPGEGSGDPPSPTPLFLDQTEARRAEKFFLGDRPGVWMAAPPTPPPPTLLSEGLDPVLIIITPVREDCVRDLLEAALHLAARTLRYPGISQSSLMSFFYSSFRTHSSTPLDRCIVTLLVTSILLAWLVCWVTRE